MESLRILCAIFIGLWVFNDSESVRITQLDIPRGASFEAQLSCKYDLENETLYDVKWYKDDEQFFRCMANETVQQFTVEGIYLKYSDMALEGDCAVTLIQLNSNSSGIYKCEVSLDYPTFTNVAMEEEFKFVEASQRTQNNEALRNSNEVDEDVTATTTISPTHIMEPWPINNNERFLVSGSASTMSNYIVVFIINLYLYCLYI